MPQAPRSSTSPDVRISSSIGALAPTEVAARPSYNTGTGLFVLNGTLYDSRGIGFMIRGTNLDQPLTAFSGLVNANVNAVRLAVRYNDASASTYASFIASSIAAINCVAIPVFFQDASGTNTSGSTADTGNGSIANAVSWWVAAFSALSSSQKHLIINVANEWGAASSPDWNTQYASAISALRTAGYTCPIMIDSGHFAQDINDLTSYAAGLFAGDPQKNIIFSMHSYGNSATLLSGNQLGTLASLSASCGAVFALMEFGPGGNVGPDPTSITPQQLITAADPAGIGWCSWAWDDSSPFNLPVTPGGPFTGTPATASTSPQLTPYGQAVVPYYATAVKATDFP